MVTKTEVKSGAKKNSQKIDPKKIRTLNLKTEHEVAMDFAVKVMQKFAVMVKSVVLFGSVAKREQVAGSDVDILIIIDDVSVNWDQELIAWYREELDKILKTNPYKIELHINTVKLSTWWEDLLRGEPSVVNMLRYGEAMVDDSAFFNPLKFLLIKGKIRSSPEAIYNCIQRAPQHIAQSKAYELMAIEGLYWSMVDSAHAALIAANVFPPSPEHIPISLRHTFVDAGKLKVNFVKDFVDLQMLHKQVERREIANLAGAEIDAWQKKAEDFMSIMIQIVKEIVE